LKHQIAGLLACPNSLENFKNEDFASKVFAKKMVKVGPEVKVLGKSTKEPKSNLEAWDHRDLHL